MDDKLIIATVAAVAAIAGGLITAVVAPVIKHLLEQASVRKERRRAQIQKWRQMVLDVGRTNDGNMNPGAHLQIHPEFLSLEPLLSEDARRSVYSENRTWVIGQALAAPLQTIKNEISRIEHQWKL